MNTSNRTSQPILEYRMLLPLFFPFCVINTVENFFVEANCAKVIFIVIGDTSYVIFYNFFFLSVRMVFEYMLISLVFEVKMCWFYFSTVRWVCMNIMLYLRIFYALMVPRKFFFK